MSKLLLTTAAFALAAAAMATLGAAPARADANAPVCAVIYNQGGPVQRCDFVTYAQCRATVYGLAGQCIDNPYLRESLARMPPRP
jgi:hypothetical protein